MSDALNTLKTLGLAGMLEDIDIQFAGLVHRGTGSDAPALLYAAALVSHVVGKGHVCLNLETYAGKPFPGEPVSADNAGTEASVSEVTGGSVPILPVLPDWLAALATDSARKFIGGLEGNCPLILIGTRLYLRRYWEYEKCVGKSLLALANTDGMPVELPAGFEDRLAAYFPVGAGGAASCDRQRAAARNAFGRRLSILSGGPGTGKTYTLARIVSLLVEFQPGNHPLQVRIAAPTGKAAARAVESIRKAKEDLKTIADPDTLKQVPEEASTLHRLLGSIPNSPYFRHHRDNPLVADLVIIDEASMVDLPLMAKLLDALPANCRLMLVGDRHQLASVEPGRVYGDLCEAADATEELRACLTELTFSHRFPPSSGIGKIAGAVNGGQKDAWQVLRAFGHDNVVQHEITAAGPGTNAAFESAVLHGFGIYLDAKEAGAALNAVLNFRVLCAVRRGPCGVQELNKRIEEILAHGGDGATRKLSPSGGFYDHRLILVTINDYALNLFNGDVGVVLKNKETSALEAWFPTTSALGEPGTRAVPVNLLPEHETAFAMTVHKSQGSEFQKVALVLPTERDSPVLTRELLYTGITRVRESLGIWCTEASFTAAVDRCTQRETGLSSFWTSLKKQEK